MIVWRKPGSGGAGPGAGLMHGVSVNGGASLVAKFGTNILFQKHLKLLFKNLFGPLPIIGDWIQKYVQICHGFPFLKWCDTSQSVQRFGCKNFGKFFWRRGGGGHFGSSPLIIGCLPILESNTLKFNLSVTFDPMKLFLGWNEDIDLVKGNT